MVGMLTGIGPALQGAVLAGGIAVAAVGGGFAWQFMPFVGPQHVEDGLRKDVASITANRDQWKAQFGGEQQSFQTSEAQRKTEGDQAKAALQAASLQCETRVAEARRSAVAIHATVTKEPTYDAKNCPVRELVPASELRNDLQPGPAPGR